MWIVEYSPIEGDKVKIYCSSEKESKEVYEDLKRNNEYGSFHRYYELKLSPYDLNDRWNMEKYANEMTYEEKYNELLNLIDILQKHVNQINLPVGGKDMYNIAHGAKGMLYILQDNIKKLH